MNTTLGIFRHSAIALLLIPLFAVWGFWQTYFTASIRPLSGIDHAHGLAMFGWCLMLILQATLIRQSRRKLHRTIGKFSYALVPFIVISTLSLANQQINTRGVTGEGEYILMLQLTMLLQFVVIYSLAIKHRKQSDVHARYMICTALPMIDPIFARILMLDVLPPESLWLTQYFTYGLTDLVLIALVVWDWRSLKRTDVFVPVLFLLVITQLPTFLVVHSSAWVAFAGWYMGLPIS